MRFLIRVICWNYHKPLDLEEFGMAKKTSTSQKMTIIRPSEFRKAISGKVLLHLTAAEGAALRAL
jgi:hypothetical protein